MKSKKNASQKINFKNVMEKVKNESFTFNRE